MTETEGRSTLWIVVILALLGILVVFGMIGFRAGPEPEVSLQAGLPAIGKRTPITVKVAEPSRGLSRVRIEFVQGDRIELLTEKNYSPRPAWAFWGNRTERDEIRVEVGRETIQGLKGGNATIRATADRARSWFLSPPPVIQELTVPVRLTPPSLNVTSTQTYVAQGGCEAVVYRVGESAVKHGVRAGSWWFPGFPLPGGGKQDRFALFAVPYDMGDASAIKLVASDDVGNEAIASFIDKFFPKPFKKDTIQLSDDFMNKVVPAIMAQATELSDRGSLLDNFLAINSELRKSNNKTLADLAAKSKMQFLWTRPFLPLPNAKVMSAFADRRTYIYQGRDVDHQDHLGYDLAAVRATPVPAANDGVVVVAKFFGIYGNAVVIDHGYGLMTLYGHLSSIDVKEGQQIKREETVGRTGDTGLAGGDHLHFSVLLQGLATNPKEWWDGHWIRDRIARKLTSGFTFQE